MRRIALVSVALVVVLTMLAGCGGASGGGEGAASSGSSGSAGDQTQGDGAASQEIPTEVPAAPADVSGMQGWLDKAYPDAPWSGRVKKIEYVSGEVPESGGFANAIVVTTDLDFEKELEIANALSAAIGEAHPGWAKQFVVRFADGGNMLAGDIVDPTP